MQTVKEYLQDEYGHVNENAQLKYNVLFGVFGIHWWGGKEKVIEIKQFLEEMVDACEREIIDMENDNG